MKKLFLIAVVSVFFLASCKKYSDGPTISFASKKGRVAGTWKIDKYLLDGVDRTSDYRLSVASESYVLEKDGKYTTTQTETALGGGQTFTDAGTWTFIDKKLQITMLSSTVGAKADTSEILKLKSKEMWIKSVSGTPVTEIHFVQ